MSSVRNERKNEIKLKSKKKIKNENYNQIPLQAPTNSRPFAFWLTIMRKQVPKRGTAMHNSSLAVVDRSLCLNGAACRRPSASAAGVAASLRLGRRLRWPCQAEKRPSTVATKGAAAATAAAAVTAAAATVSWPGS